MFDRLDITDLPLAKLKHWMFCVFVQGTAQVSLADCEGSAEMVYHWLRVQMLSGTELPRPEHKSLSHRRHHDSQEDEHRPRAMVNMHTCMHFCPENKTSGQFNRKWWWHLPQGYGEKHDRRWKMVDYVLYRFRNTWRSLTWNGKGKCLN